MPLRDRRILVTRAPHQASSLADALRELGATPILLPTIEIAGPASYAALDAALACLNDFDVVAFTSANAVEAFARRAKLAGITPAPRQVAVVGPATKRAVEAIGLRADVVPPEYTAESLAETLVPTLVRESPGARVLLALAEDAPVTLASALAAAGARVTVAAAYSNRVPEASLAAVGELFSGPSHYPDAATFTSASTARNLAALLEAAGMTLPSSVVRASIGPVTSAAMRELGMPPQIEAVESTIPGLVAALAEYFDSGPRC